MDVDKVRGIHFGDYGSVVENGEEVSSGREDWQDYCNQWFWFIYFCDFFLLENLEFAEKKFF